MKVDLQRSLRRLKPGRRSGSLARRPNADLTFVGPFDTVGIPVLLDTTVYIDVLQGSTPPEVDALLSMGRPLIHLSVVLGELAHNFGRLDPAHPATAASLRQLTGVVEDIPPRKVEDNISAGVLLEAGILTGLVYRLGGFHAGQEVDALNDATIFLHALKRGYAVLTGSLRDFDLMQQIVLDGRVLLD